MQTLIEEEVKEANKIETIIEEVNNLEEEAKEVNKKETPIEEVNNLEDEEVREIDKIDNKVDTI